MTQDNTTSTIAALIEAGEKATQGEFSHSREDMLSFCAHNGHQQSFVYPPKPNERICVETQSPVEDAQFFAKAANARPAIKALYESAQEMAEALVVARDNSDDTEEMDYYNGVLANFNAMKGK